MRTVQGTITKTIDLHLSLTEEQAQFLKIIVQNPIGDLESETTQIYNFRMSLFNTLRDLGV
jgi:hypothetical protein